MQTIESRRDVHDCPELDAATTMCDLLLSTAARHPDAVAVRAYGSSAEWTYRQLMARAAAVAVRLRGLGVSRGVTVGIMLRNRPEFHVVDAAAMMLGAVPFSIYNTFAPGQIRHVVTDAGADVVITESCFVPVLAAARDLDTPIQHLLTVDEIVDDCANLLEEMATEDIDVDLDTARRVRPDDLLTLIYTSGTTGPHKGVELTHAGMLAQLRGVHAIAPLPQGGRQISFLPAAHVADRWTSHYSALMTYANTVTCVADAADLPAALIETRPTIFGAVPRVWEKLKTALETAYPHDVAANATADPALAASLRERLGLDQARWVITGAAPVSRAVVEFFLALGLPLCEMLGMSEASCVVATTTPDTLRAGSVGRPLPTIETRLADDGELLLRGPQIMRGYRGRPDQTAEAIDTDGWFHTGDVARIDDGFIWIVDRKKELIINAAGKNMSPATIELAIRSAGNLIAHACVIGEARPYNVALLVLDPDTVAGATLGAPELYARVAEQVDRANATLSRVEQIKRFLILDDNWTPGLQLTPTMKLRRAQITTMYAAQIDNLYDTH